MTLEQTLYDFSEIVPTPTFVEKNLPTFLRLAQQLGYFQPIVKEKKYPDELIVNMPVVPYCNYVKTDQPDALRYFFKKTEEVVSKITAKDNTIKQIKFQLDSTSFQRVTDIQCGNERGLIAKNKMHRAAALSDYSRSWFEHKGYHVFQTQFGENYIQLELKKI